MRGMSFAAPRNLFESFFISFALLIGKLGSCVHHNRHRTEQARPGLDAVRDRLSTMFARVQRAVLAHEAGRPIRMPSAACHEAAAAARAARASDTSGASGETAPRRERARSTRLPQGFGWLLRFVPEAEAYDGWLREILNEPTLPELLAREPSVRRTLLSLCNMLGVGNFMVQPAQEAALGRYVIGRGWRVRQEPASPGAWGTARPAAASRRQDE